VIDWIATASPTINAHSFDERTETAFTSGVDRHNAASIALGPCFERISDPYIGLATAT
jgi:hypothetical protein